MDDIADESDKTGPLYYGRESAMSDPISIMLGQHLHIEHLVQDIFMTETAW